MKTIVLQEQKSVEDLEQVAAQQNISAEVLLNTLVSQYILPGVWVIGDEEGNELILGRDVLNRLCLLLDGLKLATEIIGF